MEKAFEDLDDLVQRVRHPIATRLFREAVGCYQIGSFRAAVVSAWTACAVDLLLKLRDLEHSGDTKAAKLLAKFEAARDAGDVGALLALEREVLKLSQSEFEFVSREEHEDLERLRSDRHRCAHPTLRETDEPYQPSPELTRSHLRTAVDTLLSQTAVQGKAAMGRLKAEVDSEYFPTNDAEALTVLQGGPLKRPRPALLRNFVIATYKALLGAEKPMPSPRWLRFRVALGAVKAMHPLPFNEISRAELPRISAAVADEDMLMLAALVARMPECFSWLHDGARIKLQTFVREMPVSPSLFFLLGGEVLREQALARVSALTTAELAKLVASAPAEAANVPAITARAMQLFLAAGSFATANDIIVRIMNPLARGFSEEQVAVILDAARDHSEYRHAGQTHSLLKNLHDTRPSQVATFVEQFKERGLETKFPGIIAGAENDDPDDIPF